MAPSAEAIRPDYLGGSIVNLMSSIAAAYGAQSSIYPELSSLGPDRLREFNNVVLIVLDGLGYNYVTHTGAGNFASDHLAGRMTSVFPSTTATAIPVFLSGHPAQQHGLTGWFTYLNEFDAVAAVLPFTERGSNAPLDHSGVGPLQLTDQVPIFDRLDTTCHTVMPVDIAYSIFNRAFSGQALIHPYQTLGQMFDRIIRLSREDGPKYIHAYWPGFDRLAHEHGIDSHEVQSHFQQIDAELRRFKRSLSGTDTLVIITADHGFIDVDPAQMVQLEHHPALAETLMMPLSGEPRVAYCYVYPDHREQFEAYIHDELSERVIICDSQDLLRNEYYGLGTAHPNLTDRIGHYTLITTGRTIIKDWVAGERPYRHIGVHGGVSADEMYVPLIVVEC